MSARDASGSAPQHSHPHNNTMSRNEKFWVDQVTPPPPPRGTTPPPQNFYLPRNFLSSREPVAAKRCRTNTRNPPPPPPESATSGEVPKIHKFGCSTDLRSAMQNGMITPQPTPHHRLCFVPTSTRLIPPSKSGKARRRFARRLVGRQVCRLWGGGVCTWTCGRPFRCPQRTVSARGAPRRVRQGLE